jgi:ABC-2 type transport system permease protein
VIILAAIGGGFVPLFFMPDYLKQAGLFSPLYWGLNAF